MKLGDRGQEDFVETQPIRSADRQLIYRSVGMVCCTRGPAIESCVAPPPLGACQIHKYLNTAATLQLLVMPICRANASIKSCYSIALSHPSVIALPHDHNQQEVPKSSVSPATAPATLQSPTLASSCSSPLAFPPRTDCKDTHYTLSGSIWSRAPCMPLLAIFKHNTSAIILRPDVGWRTTRTSLRSTSRSLRMGSSRKSR